jgi:hypothetical protein
MVKLMLAFDEVGKVGLADLGSQLSRPWLGQSPKKPFPSPGL